jgi:hypothetical protein
MEYQPIVVVKYRIGSVKNAAIALAIEQQGVLK